MFQLSLIQNDCKLPFEGGKMQFYYLWVFLFVFFLGRWELGSEIEVSSFVFIKCVLFKLFGIFLRNTDMIELMIPEFSLLGGRSEPFSSIGDN